MIGMFFLWFLIEKYSAVENSSTYGFFLGWYFCLFVIGKIPNILVYKVTYYSV